ncbi:MAG TPA: FAD-binding oxidoreductase [candidate division Zixibacteria bacterium]|nr:FAD-binding oxidoreductase [candidate division Zixibacteria bacterium]
MDLPSSAFSPPPEPVPFWPDPAADPPPGAEVVIVGAGMLGAMAALRLAERGLRPLVIEANAPASGASGRLAGMALAGLGGHYPRVTALVQAAGGPPISSYTTRSLDLLEELDERLGGAFAWRRSGSLDLFRSEAEEAHGRRLADLQAAEGLEVRVIGPDELAEVAPALATDSVRAAKWSPRDGQLHPIKMVYALLAEATRLGAEVVTGVRVEGVLVRSGRVAGVRTSHGEVAAGAVLLATNAWSGWLVPPVAENLTPIREHVCVTEPLPPLLGPGFETHHCNEYWRQLESGEVLIGGFTEVDENMGIGSYSMEVRPQVPPMLADLLGRLHPEAADARIVRCWAGLLDFASLEVPMFGPLPAADGTPIPGGYLACGLTGHGLPYAPIIGVLLAELIADGRATTLPLEPFDPRRYAGVRHAPTWLEPFGVTVS